MRKILYLWMICVVLCSLVSCNDSDDKTYSSYVSRFVWENRCNHRIEYFYVEGCITRSQGIKYGERAVKELEGPSPVDLQTFLDGRETHVIYDSFTEGVIIYCCIGNIIRFCNRPFEDVEMMNETIISNWNNTVGLDDTVFHLGDFCLGGSAEWTKILDRLNGKIYLILGNHDLKNLRQGYVDRFEHVTMQMHIEVDKQKIYLNHYPFLCFDGGYKDVWQLFGHVHTRKNNTGIDAARLQYLYPTQYDVGVDNNNFMPVSFAQMKIIIEKQVEQLKMKEQ